MGDGGNHVGSGNGFRHDFVEVGYQRGDGGFGMFDEGQIVDGHDFAGFAEERW